MPLEVGPNDYVVSAMPVKVHGRSGLQRGRATCPADRPCPFTIKTDFNYDNFCSGGLGIHFCLNHTATGADDASGMVGADGCACVGASPDGALPPGCVPLEDHHDGTYSGSLSWPTISPHATDGSASFRFFQRSPALPGATSTFKEIVIGLWADGSACPGSKAGPDFQSRGGNCFADVAFL